MMLCQPTAVKGTILGHTKGKMLITLRHFDLCFTRVLVSFIWSLIVPSWFHQESVE